MTRPFSIRQIAPGDIGLCRALNALFVRAFEEEEPIGGAPPSAAYLAGLIAGRGLVALVAMRGEAVLGGLVAYELPKFEQERSEIFVYDLAVDAPYRRQGIATALLEALKPIAAARGADVIFIQAAAEDAAAIAVYSRLGTREDAAQFDIAVDAPPR